MLKVVVSFLAFSLLAAAPGVAAPVGDETAPLAAASAAAAGGTHVHIAGFAYDPDPVNVAVGTTITWDNHDSSRHTVTADDHSWGSGELSQGESYSRTFNAAGSYFYYCVRHPSMTGTIAVEANHPPVVSISSPAPGAVVAGTVTVTGTAEAFSAPLDRVEVAVDSGAYATASGTSAWSFTVDTTTLADGDHQIHARAYDGLGYSSVATVTVRVQNGPNVPPTIAITFPVAGAQVSGTLVVSGSASDPDGAVTRVEVWVDDASPSTALGTSAWTHMEDSRALANGPHTVHARAFDGVDWSPVASRAITVLNLPDLTIRAGEFRATARTTSQDLSATVRNVGTAPAGPFSVTFYYVYKGALHPIGEAEVSGLAEGGSATVGISWNTLGKIGRFDLVAKVDVANVVPELGESNNEATAQATILLNVDGVDALDP